MPDSTAGETRTLPFAYTVSLLAVIALLTWFQSARLQQVGSDREQASPLPPPSSFELSVQGELIRFTWQDPAVSDLSHVAILRREDGIFPSGRGDGELILKVAPGERTATDKISLEQLPRQLFFSLFAVDRKGRYSNPVTAALFCDLSGCVRVPDLDTLIHIHNAEDAAALQELVRRQLWPGGHIPSRLPDAIESVRDDRYPQASEIHALQIEMEFGLFSRAYLFIPRSPGKVLVVYHQGHEHDLSAGAPAIDRLLALGYPVLAFNMPLVAGNAVTNGPVTRHDDLADMVRPLHYFVEPVVVGLNHAQAWRSFEAVAMLGISGGGWTTTLVAAVDPRISLAVSVAGGYPHYIRDQIPGNTGDFEQRYPDFYRRVSYLDLFTLAASGRHYLQIYNYLDPCCSQNAYALSYEKAVAARAEILGGRFEIWIDRAADRHGLSDAAFPKFLESLAALQR